MEALPSTRIKQRLSSVCNVSKVAIIKSLSRLLSNLGKIARGKKKKKCNGSQILFVSNVLLNMDCKLGDNIIYCPN